MQLNINVYVYYKEQMAKYSLQTAKYFFLCCVNKKKITCNRIKLAFLKVFVYQYCVLSFNLNVIAFLNMHVNYTFSFIFFECS